FFHSGQVAISNAIKANQDVTLILLDNGTTAMTAHQEHAGTQVDLRRHHSPIQDIEKTRKGLRATPAVQVIRENPANRSKWANVLEKAILSKGVKIVIATKECGITFHRRRRKAMAKIVKERGFLPVETHMNVTQEVCENCLECTKQTACPG